eukprot:95378-Pelagomonas_calceolata.AAC.1
MVFLTLYHLALKIKYPLIQESKLLKPNALSRTPQSILITKIRLGCCKQPFSPILASLFSFFK